MSLRERLFPSFKKLFSYFAVLSGRSKSPLLLFSPTFCVSDNSDMIWHFKPPTGVLISQFSPLLYYFTLCHIFFSGKTFSASVKIIKIISNFAVYNSSAPIVWKSTAWIEICIQSWKLHLSAAARGADLDFVNTPQMFPILRYNGIWADVFIMYGAILDFNRIIVFRKTGYWCWQNF